MPEPYLLQSEEELERLRLQARLWEGEAERLLDAIGLAPDARCLDLGCGGMGILRPLAARAGEVVGLDNDPLQLRSARVFTEEEGLDNVTVLEGDAYHTGLAPASFDLVHTRFLFAPGGRDAELLQEMMALTRPGGVIAIQEPDAASWQCWPADAHFSRLKEAILKTFKAGGGDFNAGTRMYGLLQASGLQRVQLRSAVISLPAQHPYAALPVQFAASLRRRMLAAGILSPAELDRAVNGCREALQQSGRYVTSFTVNGVWGYLPAA